MPRKTPTRHAAFTLVEILLVTSLVAGLSLAIFSCLSNGLRLWDRSRVLLLEEDAAFFFDRFSSDVRNAFLFSTLPIDGMETRLVLPTIVTGMPDKAGSRSAEGLSDGLGRVQYVFDISSGALVRRQANYSQALRDAWGAPRTLVRGLKRVRFKYYPAGTNESKLSIDISEPFPAGIEAELTFYSGTEEKTLKRFVPIPAGL